MGGYSNSGISGDKSQTTQDDNDYWIVKTDSLGNKQWDKDFGGVSDDELYSLQQTTDGGYILGGYSESGISGDKTQVTHGSYDYWIVKIDSLGNKLWDKDFGTNTPDFLFSLQQTKDGGYILGGHSDSGINGDKTQTSWGGFDIWIIKADSLGNKLWDKDFSGTSNDWLYSLRQNRDNGYILGGYSKSGMNGDKTQPVCFGVYEDYWIVKIDSLGNKKWDKDYGGGFEEKHFENIVQTFDSGYLMAGLSNSNMSCDKTENNIGILQTWVVKTDSLGNKQWDKTLLNNGKVEYGFTIQTRDGCYAMANANDAPIGGDKTQNSWNNSDDYWIIKFCDSTSTISITQLPNTQLPFSISPNPTTGTIQLTFNTKHNGAVQCEIRNVMGEKVYEAPLPASLRGGEESYAVLDVSFLAKGIYLVRVGDGERWENKKLVGE